MLPRLVGFLAHDPHLRHCLASLTLAILLFGLPEVGLQAQIWNRPEKLDVIPTGPIALFSSLGWTRIAVSASGGSINYATLSLAPVVTVGKFRAGLAIDLLINTARDPGGSILRQSDLKPGHLLRFAQYGTPSAPVFIHVGALDNAEVGHGWILSRYSNQMADQSRRVGAWVKVDRPQGGFEGIVTNVGASEIYGGRVYVRPFAIHRSRGLLARLSFGATVLIDDDPARGRTATAKPGVETYGVDIELPVIKKEKLSVVSYGDIAAIRDGGKGGTLGVNLNLAQPGDPLFLSGKLAYEQLGARFVPQFFDETYEINSLIASGQTKVDQISSLPGAQGIRGDLDLVVVHRLAVGASYQGYGGRVDSGVFHAEAHLAGVIPRLTLHAMYHKRGIKNVADIRRLDDRSVVLTEVVYKLNRYVSLGLDYRWTFFFDDAPNIQTYRPIERFFPKVIFATVF